MKLDSLEFYSPADFLQEEERCGFLVTHRRKKLWQLQLEMLQLVDAICHKYSIKYYAMGGTLLGAVRHQGFIPWDDDIDIAMFRSDYQKFVEVAQAEIKSPYFLQSPDSEIDYALTHIKIRNSLTTGATKYDFEFQYNKGVFIDVFPLDNIPDNPNEKKNLLKVVHDYRKLLDVGARHFWYWQGTSAGSKEIVSDAEKKRLTNYVESHTISGVCKDFDEYCSQYNDQQTEFCGVLALELTSERFFWKRDWFEHSQQFPFEYLSIPGPDNYDEVLKKTYGNYKSFVRGGALHGSLIFDPNLPYSEYNALDKPTFLL